MSEKHSEILKELWKEPEYRAHHAEGNERSTELRGQKLKEKWADPEFRARQKATRASVEYKEKMKASAGIRAEAMRKRWEDPEFRAHMSAVRSAFAKTRHGETAPVYKHGMYRSPEYIAYHGAKQRCNNPKSPQWPDYGGRGLKFLYLSFEQFLEEVGPRPSKQHSLDRLNNELGYQPGNCGWRLPVEQQNNRRPDWPERTLHEIEVTLHRILGSEGDGKSALDMIEMLRQLAFEEVLEYGISGC